MKKLSTLLLLSFVLVASYKPNAQCNAPVNLAASYSNNVSTFSWDTVAGASDYVLELAWAGANWGEFETICTTNVFSLTGLMQGGNFQWRVKANCGSSYSLYSSALYSTPCVAPYNLSTTDITTNSARLNWMQSATDNNINTGFSVSYRLANTNNAWLQLTNVYNNTTAIFFNLTGLTAGTAYEWRVKRVCSSSNSAYLYSQFVTLSCISSGINTNEWIDLFALGSINRTSVAEPGGYANVAASTNLVIGSSNNAGQISAGFQGNVRNQRYSIYIDFNRNGSFEDTGEKLINSATINNAGIKNFMLTIPATVTAGPTRMRIVMRRSSGTITSCITGYYGETEDYNVNLVASTNLRGAKETETVSHAKPELVSDFSVSPNPSGGIFTITLPIVTGKIFYELVNMNGSVIQRNTIINQGVFTINIANQPAGIYILRIIDKKGSQQLQKLQKF